MFHTHTNKQAELYVSNFQSLHSQIGNEGEIVSGSMLAGIACELSALYLSIHAIRLATILPKYLNLQHSDVPYT